MSGLRKMRLSVVVSGGPDNLILMSYERVVYESLTVGKVLEKCRPALDEIVAVGGPDHPVMIRISVVPIA